MSSSPLARYNRSFYVDQVALSQASADAVVPLVLDLYRPNSVVDVGCGVGTWLRAFHDRGVKEMLGFDGGNADRDLLKIPEDRYRVADFTHDFAAGLKFDLAVCLEVAEHLPADRAAAFVRRLTELAPVVLFSAAVPRQGGTGHVNEQWPTYWAGLFANHGYSVVDAIRPLIWNNENVAAYYAQNLLLFADASAISANPALAAASSAAAGPIDIVHPRIFERKLSHPLLRTVAEALPEPVKNRITARLRPMVSFLRKV